MNVWPPYPAVVVADCDLVEANPEVAGTLNQLAPLFDGARVSSLNAQVDREGMGAETFTRQFRLDNEVISAE